MKETKTDKVPQSDGGIEPTPGEGMRRQRMEEARRRAMRQ